MIKERILKTGLKGKFLAGLIGVDPSRFSQFIQGSIDLKQDKKDRLEYILTQYEKIQL